MAEHAPLKDYATALRVIGQELAAHGAMIYEITLDEDGFLVQCDSDRDPRLGLLKLRYDDAKIDHLDRLGRKKRNTGLGASSFDTIPNVLRSIGGYVTSRKTRLIRLTNFESPGASVLYTIEHETRYGGRVVDNCLESSIYDFAIHMYKQRDNPRSSV